MKQLNFLKTAKVISSLVIVSMGLGIFNISSYAAPVCQDGQSGIQPSEEQIKYQTQGDESLSFDVSDEESNDDVDNNDNLDDNDNLDNNDDADDNDNLDSSTETTNTPIVNGDLTTESPVLVVLVEYNDRKLTFDKESDWSDVFFSNKKNSVRKYYAENSSNKHIIVPVKETYNTQNDGVIKVSLDQNHPCTQALEADDIKDNGKLKSETRKYFKSSIPDIMNSVDQYLDFASYDKNRNNKLESRELALVFVVAGFEASFNSPGSPKIHGYRSSVSNISLDQIKLDKYSFAAEGEIHHGAKDHMATIGILCHELGHVFGLHDLYDTDKTSQASKGIGINSLMAGGNWGYDSSASTHYKGSCPAHLDAYSKIKLGYIKPIVIDNTENKELYVSSFASSHGQSIVRVNTSDEKQYFLVENRQFNGYDKALKNYYESPGIAIWHIDERVEKNGDESHKRVDLEEANLGTIGYSELDADSKVSKTRHYFDAAQGFSTFSDTTVPSSNLYGYGKSPLGMEISVGEANGQNDVYVKFTKSNGSDNLALNKPATANREVKNEGASKAVNGTNEDIHDKWCSGRGYGDDSWLSIDLGERKVINHWKVVHGKGSPFSKDADKFTQDFKLQSSDDGENWTDRDEVTNNTDGITDKYVSQFSARYVRLYIIKADNDNCARIYDFELFNTPINVNLALGKSVEASSKGISFQTPEKAVNGTKLNKNDKWCTKASADGEWLNVDLGSPCEINKWIVIHGKGSGLDKSVTRSFKLKVSDDGINWKEIDSVENNTDDITERSIAPTIARYVQLYIDSPDKDGCVRIYEFQVFNVQNVLKD